MSEPILKLVASGLPNTVEDYQVALNAAFAGGVASGKAQAASIPKLLAIAKEQAKTDSAVTPEYLAWLESIYPRNGVGGNEAWNAGVAWHKAQKVAERNFCERCGKRIGMDGHIHTCTPPQEG